MVNNKKDSSSWESMSILLGILGFLIFKSSLFIIFSLLGPVFLGKWVVEHIRLLTLSLQNNEFVLNVNMTNSINQQKSFYHKAHRTFSVAPFFKARFQFDSACNRTS